MQRAYMSPGKTQCRYCGEQVLINHLTTHILKNHRLSVRSNMSPTLVKKSDNKTDRP
jgi:hypothetical protein